MTQDEIAGRTSDASVALLSVAPDFQRLERQSSPKVKIGDPIHFSVDVHVTPNGKKFGKRAIVMPSTSGGPIFEIHANEPKSVGGTDEDPTPMAYFTAGLALCFMSHVMGYVKVRGLDVQKIALELRGNYMTELGHVDRAGQGRGGARNFETHVIIDSSEPRETIAELVAICEEACVAHQTMVNAIPGNISIVHNGKIIDAA
ncbi:OsmC family protein [Sphingomonadaceae bacterium G21617-S1]|nr:OsmC family protein [Sphingomonadaceae bacterium G21617-S1]